MPSGKLQRAGALWLKEGRKGKFLSGVFEPRGRAGPKYQILVFRNHDKDPKAENYNPKSPDYQIMMAEPEADNRPEDPTDGPPEI